MSWVVVVAVLGWGGESPAPDSVVYMKAVDTCVALV